MSFGYKCLWLGHRYPSFGHTCMLFGHRYLYGTRPRSIFRNQFLILKLILQVVLLEIQKCHRKLKSVTENFFLSARLDRTVWCHNRQAPNLHVYTHTHRHTQFFSSLGLEDIFPPIQPLAKGHLS